MSGITASQALAESGDAQPSDPLERVTSWARQFREEQGRAPTVLHIGNIAANAYNNAHLMHRLGFDCDVLCIDYYHIMGCPEWEDADFDGFVDDDFRPNWTLLNLNGFRRPKWFSQSHAPLALRYLAARRAGRRKQASRLWREISIVNRTRQTSRLERFRVALSSSQRLPGRIMSVLTDERRLLAQIAMLPGRARNLWAGLFGSARFFARRWISTARYLVRRALIHLIHIVTADEFEGLKTGSESAQSQPVRNAVNAVGRGLNAIFRFVFPSGFRTRIRETAENIDDAEWRWLRASKDALFQLARLPVVLIGALVSVVAIASRALVRMFRFAETGVRGSVGDDDAASVLKAVDERVERLVREFNEAFPDRPDPLRVEDFESYRPQVLEWHRLFTHYDFVQGYAMDPIWPMIAGKPYFAFEHGTLRELPFQDTAGGRLTACAYHFSEHAFVTNSDCMDNARLLTGERCSPLPHPFDENHANSVRGHEALRRQFSTELDAEFLFFFPTRQDWVPGTGFADKGNDQFLRAFARLAAAGYAVGLVACEWGRNVDESRELLSELGCESRVHWTKPLGVRRYERTMKACDVVVDQFVLGAFGGVTFRALAAARAVCTYLKADEVAQSFGSCPPIINCRTEDEIFKALSFYLDDRKALKALSADARTWVEAHHSGRATALNQLARYIDSYEARNARPA